MKKYLLGAFIVSLAAFILYIYKLQIGFSFHPDFARDLHEVLRISQGDITLLGPKLTFGGIYSGPYYFYLFVPAFIVSSYNIYSLHVFSALLFALGVGYFFIKTADKYGQVNSFLASLTILILPWYVIGARNPSNAFTFLPLLLFLLTYIFYNKPKSIRALTLLGLLLGIIINFHFINVILVIPLLLYFWQYLKNKKVLFLFLIGIGLAFTPLILFELRHDFIMFKNTFVQQSYLSWTENKNIPGGVSGKKNVIANIFFMSEHIRSLIGINPLIMYAVLGMILYFKKVKKEDWILFSMGLLTLVSFASIIRFQFIFHYLYSTALMLSFIAIYLVLRNRLSGILIILIIFALTFFPQYIYQPRDRKHEPFEKAVEYVVSHNLLKKDANFNVIQITKERILATIGFEYRYFLRKEGYVPRTEFEYNDSQELIIFSEMPDLDLAAYTSWEAEQFGKQHFKNAHKYQAGTITIYKITK
ncbi:MAG: hypothetical protein WC774_05665 [Candidatus Gracilibacteria bacterium]|jgi:hypothetical protein